jgi:hypothetical protein
MNPLDTYLDSRPGEKTAAPRDFMKGLSNTLNPQGLGQAAGAAAIAGGVALAGTAAQKIFGAITKKRDFDMMMHYAPDLREEQSRNPDLFNRQYSSLRSLNPQFAGDPIIASTYMRRMSMTPESAGSMLVESLGHQQKPKPEPAWLQAGMKKLPTGHEVEMQGMQRQQAHNALNEYEEMAPVRQQKRQRALEPHGYDEHAEG